MSPRTPCADMAKTRKTKRPAATEDKEAPSPSPQSQPPAKKTKRVRAEVSDDPIEAGPSQPLTSATLVVEAGPEGARQAPMKRKVQMHRSSYFITVPNEDTGAPEEFTHTMEQYMAKVIGSLRRIERRVTRQDERLATLEAKVMGASRNIPTRPMPTTAIQPQGEAGPSHQGLMTQKEQAEWDTIAL